MTSDTAPLPRRTTRGPLDDEDPLTSSATSVSSPIVSNVASPSPSSPAPPAADLPPVPTTLPDNIRVESELLQPQVAEKDLSFLLDQAVYHPLSQLNVAAPFRRPLSVLPSTVNLQQALTHLETALSTCDFLSAAHLAATILTSHLVKPTDSKTIFRLLSIRYSCLEITGNTMLAAQEAKALEDITSTFYYFEPVDVKPDSQDADTATLPEHIMPFALRVQALRLQSLGFSDPRRGITALYDLGLECREHLTSKIRSSDDYEIWHIRLQEVGVRVLNSLIEMDDLECANRSLKSMKPTKGANSTLWTFRMVLLSLKIGEIDSARRLIGEMGLSKDVNMFEPLLAVAEGRYDDAIAGFEAQQAIQDKNLAALVKQNLAVAYLYTGNVEKAKEIFQELVEAGNSFQSLTINLATVYELTSDKSKDMKMALAGKMAKQQKESNHLRPMSNTDFKL